MRTANADRAYNLLVRRVLLAALVLLCAGAATADGGPRCHPPRAPARPRAPGSPGPRRGARAAGRAPPARAARRTRRHHPTGLRRIRDERDRADLPASAA